MAFPVEEKFLIALEQKINIVFPYSYRVSIQKVNGGCIIHPRGEEAGVWFLFPIFDDTDKKRLKRSAFDLFYENKKAWEEYGLPTDLYAIGGSDGEYIVFKKNSDGTLNNTVFFYENSTGLAELVEDFSLFKHEA